MGLELYAKIEQYLDFKDEVAYLHDTFCDIVSEINPKSLLDIGCGQGDFLAKLDTNIKTLGIDLSHTQVNIAKEKGLDVKAVPLSQIDEKFDMQTAVFDVINYIPKSNIESFFQECYDRLNKNGYFVFDINTLFGFDEVAQGAIVLDKEEMFISIDAYFDKDILKTYITAFSKVNNDLYTKEQDTITQYYHTKEFMKKTLKKVGFKIEQILEFKLHGYDKADKNIYICCK
ncbi:class I SAM-dependent DNA methyltransferase [Arcobacter sp. FWKO B]|uniref:class I SAM-dependent DNA methyltransferase n=1 Tax=Arcobacter sp. FWKO B TaxID=2593672 RepID=UPI0018A69DEF|nr:class I SAM-dependent methyltransferase [Arcobacter sp. FWKO B]QOG12899.1 methyltransferase domain-containing protein [Arcobacter sp. FWKO B]